MQQRARYSLVYYTYASVNKYTSLMSGLFVFRGTCHIKVVKLSIQTSHNTSLGHMHAGGGYPRTLTCDASICGLTRPSSMHASL